MESVQNIILRLDDGQAIGRSQHLLGDKRPKGEVLKVVRVGVIELSKRSKVRKQDVDRSKAIKEQLTTFEQQTKDKQPLRNLKNDPYQLSDEPQKENINEQTKQLQNNAQRQQVKQPQKQINQEQQQPQYQGQYSVQHPDENHSHQAIEKDQQELSKKYLQIISKILQDLGKFRHIFENPVDSKDYPTYRGKIKKPMDLGNMKKKVQNNEYQYPQQFKEDMLLVWNNCKSFNGEGEFVYNLGVKMEEQFEQLWIQYGFDYKSGSGNRARRLNAGQHSQKFDADNIYEHNSMPSTQKKAKSNKQKDEIFYDSKNPQNQEVSSGQQSNSQIVAVNPYNNNSNNFNYQQFQRQQQQLQNQKSNAYLQQTDAVDPFQNDMQNQGTFKSSQYQNILEHKQEVVNQRGVMGQGLKELIAGKIENDEEIMEGCLAIIQNYMQVCSNEDGEVELDIDQIDDATLWHLYDYLTEKNMI